jgi:MHS family proline/betaine transporter-like MFS transporter
LADRTTRGSRTNVVVLVSGIFLGNLLVWYDIAVYAFFAAYIAKAFFPAGDSWLGIVYAYGTFALAYIVRPVGAVVLGGYADRVGRRQSMLASVALLFLGTLIIAVLPDYHMIGLAAPLGLMTARVIQGFAAGGEFGSVTSLLAEQAPANRGLLASLQMSSQMVSGMLAASLGLLLTSTLTPQQLVDWGWRIPFVIGLAIGPVGLFLRYRMPEVREPSLRRDSLPIKHLLASYKLRLVVGVSVIVLSSAIAYTLAYLPVYTVKSLGLTAQSGFLAALLAFSLQAVIAPASGYLSDRFGRLPVLFGCALLVLVSCLPAFLLLTLWPSVAGVVAVVVWLAIVKAFYMGPMPALLTELFPAPVRASGVALSYNLAVTIFGGTGPLIMAWLAHILDNKFEPAIYITAAAGLSAVAVALAFTLTRYED